MPTKEHNCPYCNSSRGYYDEIQLKIVYKDEDYISRKRNAKVHSFCADCNRDITDYLEIVKNGGGKRCLENYT